MELVLLQAIVLMIFPLSAIFFAPLYTRLKVNFWDRPKHRRRLLRYQEEEWAHGGTGGLPLLETGKSYSCCFRFFSFPLNLSSWGEKYIIHPWSPRCSSSFSRFSWWNWIRRMPHERSIGRSQSQGLRRGLFIVIPLYHLLSKKKEVRLAESEFKVRLSRSISLRSLTPSVIRLRSQLMLQSAKAV